MKMFKKIVSVLCAVSMIMATAIPAFAADTAESSIGVLYIPAYDENAVYGLVDSGILDDGTEYWVIHLTPEEVVRQQMAYDWSGKARVPISNGNGTNGAVLGDSFYPDPFVVVNVGPLPSNMSSVNIGFYYDNGSNSEWYPSVHEMDMVVFRLKYPSNSGCIKVSTENESKTAAFSFYTSETNPKDCYLEVKDEKSYTEPDQ